MTKSIQRQQTGSNLPVFQGESWEDHVSAWIQVSQEVDEKQWQLGAIATSVKTTYGQESIKKFAGEVMRKARIIYYYIQVHDTFQKCKRLQSLSWSHHLIASESDDPEAALADAEDNGLSVEAMRQRISEKKQQARTEEGLKLIADVAPADRYRLIHCDIAKAHKKIEPESVDVIITDPPYPQEYVPLYEDLAKLAAHALKPNGSMLVMVGQSYLPDILALMTPHIRYNWTVAYLTPGGQSAQLWQRKVNTFWKPVFWFINGDEYAGDWIGDVAKSAVNDNDKRFHEWGQSESGMADLIERFSYPGDTILDPFLGGGTTGLVALKLDRLFIGIDSDKQAIETTKQRLAA